MQIPAKKITALNRLIFIGNLNKHKGIHLLLRVLHAIPENKRPSLEILGIGEMKDELETYCIDNKLTNQVTFHGMQKDVSAFIEKSDVLILPTYTEAFALVLVEALRTGIPVITTDAKYGPREILAIDDEITERDYIETTSGILLAAPSYIEDVVEDMSSTTLTPFEKRLLSVLSKENNFIVDETLCDRFDKNKIVSEWKELLNKICQ